MSSVERTGLAPKITQAWRRYRAALDPGLGLALALGLLSVWPFLVWPGLPVFTDTEQHVYRTYEIIAAWRAGVPYVRWAADLYHGFGYPVFEYYAPLSYYLGAAYGWAFGDGGAVAGVKFVYVASALLGAAGMYLFVRDTWGAAAGLAAAAAFSLSPYLAAIEPHQLGHAPESLAIALAPFMFWAFARLRRRPTSAGVTLAALCLAASLLAHNLMPLIFVALLVGWLVWEWLLDPGLPNRWRTGAYLLGALALGATLTAFFWLPALLERGAAQLGKAIGGPYLDYRTNFLRLSELLSPLVRGDALNPHVLVFKLGLPQWLLAVGGAVAVALNRARRRTWLFWPLAAAGLLFFMLPISRPVWEAVPALTLFQFPWRLMGPLTFAVAVLVGAATHGAGQLRGRAWRLAAAPVAVATILLAGLPLMSPLPWPDFGPVTAPRIQKAEFDWEAGTTASNEFLPSAVRVAPVAVDSLLASYITGQVDKVNRATLPAGTTVDTLSHDPLGDSFAVDGPAAFTFRLYTFDFPGWTAWVDDRPTPSADSQPEGWITFQVPAGQHQVMVRLEDTPVRRWAWIVTGLAGLALAALVAWNLAPAPGAGRSAQVTPAGPLPWRQSVSFAAIVLAGWLLTVLIPPAYWWLPEVGPGLPPQPPQAVLESHVALLSYDLQQTSVRAGQPISVTLHWAATGLVSDNLRVFVHVMGPDGKLWAQSDKFHPGVFVDLPTGRWPPGYRLDDMHQVMLPAEAPPGEYQIFAGMWNGYTGLRVLVLDAQGAPSGTDRILLTSIRVGP